MICIPITDKQHFGPALQAVSALKAAGKDAGIEIRLDLCRLTEKDLADIPDLKETDTILTYRCQDRKAAGCSEEKVDCSACTSMMKLKSELIGSFEQLDLYYTERLIDALVGKGAKHIDLGDEMTEYWKKRWMDIAKEKRCRIILSHHDFSGTEPIQTYIDFYRKAIEAGADLVKIVPTAKSTEEAIALLELYHHLPAEKLIAFSMGEAGRFSRLEAWKYGSPVTYVALDTASTSANGQYDLESFLQETDPGHFIPAFSESPRSERKPTVTLSVPASKSYAQRLIICSALCGQARKLTHYTECRDNRAALQMIGQLNATATLVSEEKDSRSLLISPAGLPEGPISLNIGESGLCTRIAIALGAFLPQPVTISGEGSVLRRSFSEECGILEELGIEYRSREGRLPITVIGHLEKEKDYPDICTVQSSQFASGLLIGQHFAEKLLGYPVRLNIQTRVSGHYLKITEECLQQITQKTIAIEGDWSSAANLCTASLLSAKKTLLKNLHLPSEQPDAAVADLARHLGGRVEMAPEGILLQNTEDRPEGFRFDATDAPDLFPLLAVLAMHCKGTSELKGIGRLTNKESNRLESIYCLLTEIYGNNRSLRLEGDTLFITGIETEKTGKSLCRCYQDHRIAMAATLCGLRGKREIFLDHPECLGKSYPDFLHDIAEFRTDI